ncbi:MAG: hypothetical protein QF535_13855, partial [Anaerolineales bacterium]|nr:hypothetical protein [Anaerolineales bacterium]
INIPLQFDVLTHNTRVITDGFTASAVADALQVPDQLKTLMQETEAKATSLLGNILPTVSTSYDIGTNTFVEDAGTLPATSMDAAAQVLTGKMQGFITECTSAANGTMVAGMNQLIEMGSASSFADIQSAVSSNPFPNPALGGVQQAAQELGKFADMTAQMKSSNSELGGAISQVKDITKNAAMLSSMGTLAGGIAEAAGLPAPPSMDDAFEELANGEIGNALNTLNAGMSVVAGVASLPAYSGQLDDINDLTWQGTFTPSGMGLPFAGITVPNPTWVNPNELGGTTEGAFPTGVKMGDAMEAAKSTMLNTVESVKSKIDAALGPIATMGNATAMATGLQTQSSAFDSEFTGGLKDAAESMY